MNKKHCSVDLCDADPIIVCNCEANPIPLCINHKSDHSQLFRRHKFTPISTQIDENARHSLIKKFSNIKSDIKNSKLKAINLELTIIQKIQKSTESILLKLKFYDQQLTEIITEICSLKEIDNSKSLSFVETLLLENQPLIDKISSPKLNFGNFDLSSIDKLFYIDPIDESFDYLKFYRPNTQVIKFISAKNSRLNIFDAETLNVTRVNPVWAWNFGSDGVQCLLPNSTLFCASSYRWLNVDPIGTITPIIPYNWNSSAGAIYVDDQIYLFGGFREIAAKYVIQRKSWCLISKCSISIGLRVSCALFKNKILIGSTSYNPVFYDILIDSSSEIPSLSLSHDTTKVFAVKTEKVILFEFSQFVYENDDNLITWKIIGVCGHLPIHREISNYPLIYKEKVFMVVKDYVHIFDLNKKEWKKISW